MLEKQNLLGLTQSKFKDFFSDLSEKPFRTKQIMQWIYHQGVYNFGDMHNFSVGQLSLRLLMQINHMGLGILSAANAMRRQLT